MESPCECGIEPPGSIRHGVSWLVILEYEYVELCKSVFNTNSSHMTNKGSFGGLKQKKVFV